MPHQRREIIIPVGQIKRKMPEIGQINRTQTNDEAKDHDTAEGGGGQAVAAAIAANTGGIRIAGSKMAFALITKSQHGKKINAHKIAIDS